MHGPAPHRPAAALIAVLTALACGAFPAHAVRGGFFPAPGAPGVDRDAGLSVTIDAGALSVSAREIPLGEILSEAARLSGLRVESREALDDLVTVAIIRRPIHIALAELLRGRNYVYQYPEPRGPRSAASAPAGIVWIFSREAEITASAQSEGDSGAMGRKAPGSPPRASRDSGVAARLRAVALMTEAGGMESVEALGEAALFDESASVREEAVYALGSAGGAASMRPLEDALADPDRRVRLAAVEALADNGGEEAARALAFALGDGEPSIREAAVDALGEIGGESAIAILTAALSDENAPVREAAIEVISEISSGSR